MVEGIPMPAGYVIAFLLVSTGVALFTVGLAKVRFESAVRAEQGWARRGAYYEILPHLRLS